AGLRADQRLWQSRFIAGTGRGVGRMSVLGENGRVVRFDSEAYALSRIPDSFAVLTARSMGSEIHPDFGRIAWRRRVDEGGLLRRVLDLGGQQPFPILYADELLDSAKPVQAGRLAGRLVLVTSGFSELKRYRTPLTAWTGESLAPIQIQAQAIAQLLDR